MIVVYFVFIPLLFQLASEVIDSLLVQLNLSMMIPVVLLPPRLGRHLVVLSALSSHVWNLTLLLDYLAVVTYAVTFSIFPSSSLCFLFRIFEFPCRSNSSRFHNSFEVLFVTMIFP